MIKPFFTEEACCLLDQISFTALERFHLDKFIKRIELEKQQIKSDDMAEVMEIFDDILFSANRENMERYFSVRNKGIKTFE